MTEMVLPEGFTWAHTLVETHERMERGDGLTRPGVTYQRVVAVFDVAPGVLEDIEPYSGATYSIAPDAVVVRWSNGKLHQVKIEGSRRLKSGNLSTKSRSYYTYWRDGSIPSVVAESMNRYLEAHPLPQPTWWIAPGVRV